MWVHVLQDVILTVAQEADVAKNARLRAEITADQDALMDAIKNALTAARERAIIHVIIDVTEFVNLIVIVDVQEHVKVPLPYRILAIVHAVLVTPHVLRAVMAIVHQAARLAEVHVSVRAQMGLLDHIACRALVHAHHAQGRVTLGVVDVQDAQDAQAHVKMIALVRVKINASVDVVLDVLEDAILDVQAVVQNVQDVRDALHAKIHVLDVQDVQDVQIIV